MQACDGEAKAKRQRLTLDQFREICSKQGETDSSKQESLARLLHKLGRCCTSWTNPAYATQLC